MGLDEVLQAGWADHGDAPQSVADQLAAAVHRVGTSEQAIPFARLLVHVYGEHLGQWQQGIELLEKLVQHMAGSGSTDSAGATLQQGIASLRYASGDDVAAALRGLTTTQRVSALTVAASALAAHGNTTRAIEAFTNALQSANAGLPEGSPAIRSVAVAGNNLASTLEGKADRLPNETQAMQVCAEAALKYWKLAGTWLEVERAEYRLARSLLQADRAHDAVGAAQRCVDLCLGSGAPAFELFFGYAVLGIAQRAADQADAALHSRTAALVQWQAVPEADRSWCQNDLDELKGPGAA